MTMCIAVIDQEYAQKKVRAGKQFEVEAQHVSLLLALGRIRLLNEDTEPEKDVQALNNCQMTAESESVDRPAVTRRSYNRKAQ